MLRVGRMRKRLDGTQHEIGGEFGCEARLASVALVGSADRFVKIEVGRGKDLLPIKLIGIIIQVFWSVPAPAIGNCAIMSAGVADPWKGFVPICGLLLRVV